MCVQTVGKIIKWPPSQDIAHATHIVYSNGSLTSLKIVSDTISCKMSKKKYTRLNPYLSYKCPQATLLKALKTIPTEPVVVRE